MVLNSQYLKKSAATHNALELRIEPAVRILHDFDSYNKELFLLALNKVATDQEGVITNRIKKITEVELPNLKTKTFKLISSFSLDNPNRLVFINLITLSDISIESVQEIYTLLKTKNDYKDLDKLRRATDILNNKLKLESNGIENAVATLQHDFNLERKSKRAELTMQLNNLSRIILITNTIGIMIGLFIAFNTIRSLVNRIQILKIGAKRISKGDYEHRVCLKGNDELTMLGNNFNEMAGSLSESFEKIKRKNKELEQFVYIASHDLQEPLRTIDSFSQLLSEQFQGKLNENGNQYISFILKATTRMRCLVKDLMDYGRLGNDENLELVDCKSLVLGVKDELAEQIKIML
jgi:signal transduction histidine kinase